MSSIIDVHTEQFERALERFRGELSSLRTGRATPALVENILVEAYGTKQPVKALASITIPDPKTITIQPWDKSVLGDIEKSVRIADIGINPVNDGTCIRLPIPPMTEETRKEFIKIVGQKAEQARISVRTLRDEIREGINKKQKAGEMGEDEKYTYQEELDTIVKKYNERIKQIAEEKEAEISKI